MTYPRFGTLVWSGGGFLSVPARLLIMAVMLVAAPHWRAAGNGGTFRRPASTRQPPGVDYGV